MPVIGLDVGTTMTKCRLYREDGTVLAESSVRFPPVSDGIGMCVDAAALKRCAFEVIGNVSSYGKADAICVSSLGETFIPVKNGNPIADGILYTDKRGSEELEELLTRMDKKTISERMCVKPHNIFSLPKMMWLKKHRLEIYESADKLLLVGDYIGYLLTGKSCIGYSLAARSMAFDVEKKVWDREVLTAADIDIEKLSEPVPLGVDCGAVLPEVTEKLWLADNCRVYACGHDQVMATIGAGALTPGTAIDGMGTVDCVTYVFGAPVRDADYLSSGYVSSPQVGNNYASFAYSLDGGGFVNWFRSELCGKYDDPSSAFEGDFFGYFEKAIPDEPTRILMLPYLSGSATPYWEDDIGAAFVNLKRNTTRADMYRAIMENTSYEIRLNLDCLAACGVVPTSLAVVGGCSRSDKWLQIRADILGLPLVRLTESETGLIGCAMACCVGKGVYSDFTEAAKVFIKQEKVFTPNCNEVYEEQYAKYRKLYGFVKELCQKD